MKATHTPGPWVIDGRFGDLGNSPGTIRHKSEICGAWIPVDFKDPANARLIASTPALLAALEAIVEMASHAPGAGQSGTLSMIEARAQQAISIARNT